MAAGSYPSPTFATLTVNGTATFGSLSVSAAAAVGGLFALAANTGGFGGGWNQGDITTGASGTSGASSGRLALRYDATNNVAYIGAIAPGAAWEPLNFQAGAFSFLSNGSTQGLYQAGSGNVGIGTTTPAYVLDASGSARVTGSLILGNALSASYGGTGATSLSGGLDAAFGSTQGMLLYRGASGWAALGPGAAGQVLGSSGSGANPAWQNAGGNGTVTSVALALPTSLFTVSGSPITSSGSLTATLSAQATNTVLAGPSSGAAAAPGFRALVPADLPIVAPPQGRLTLTSGGPVLTGAVSGATSIIYTPYVGNLIPLWNGSAFVPTTFGEVAQVLSDATKSPAAAVAGAVYDLFGWLDGTTFRVTRGPAWTAGATAGSNTTRGSGAGSTALTRVQGVLVNAQAITNGPAAGYGTYLGSIATDASGATVTFNTGTAAAGGGAAVVGIWNAYNRVSVAGSVRDTTSSWTYSAAGWRAANNSATIRVTFVTGLAEDSWTATYAAIGSSGSSSIQAWAGVGLDTMGSALGTTAGTQSTALSSFQAAASAIALGQHYFSAIELNSSTSAAATWFGAPQYYIQSGLN